MNIVCTPDIIYTQRLNPIANNYLRVELDSALQEDAKLNAYAKYSNKTQVQHSFTTPGFTPDGTFSTSPVTGVSLRVQRTSNLFEVFGGCTLTPPLDIPQGITPVVSTASTVTTNYVFDPPLPTDWEVTFLNALTNGEFDSVASDYIIRRGIMHITLQDPHEVSRREITSKTANLYNITPSSLQIFDVDEITDISDQCTIMYQSGGYSLLYDPGHRIAVNPFSLFPVMVRPGCNAFSSNGERGPWVPELSTPDDQAGFAPWYPARKYIQGYSRDTPLLVGAYPFDVGCSVRVTRNDGQEGLILKGINPYSPIVTKYRIDSPTSVTTW